MAHCPPALLDDLADLFDELATWDGVVQKSPGVFYLRRQPFLHFHIVEGDRRHADVRRIAGWVRVDLPRPATPARRRALVAELRRSHREKAKR